MPDHKVQKKKMRRNKETNIMVAKMKKILWCLGSCQPFMNWSWLDLEFSEFFLKSSSLIYEVTSRSSDEKKKNLFLRFLLFSASNEVQRNETVLLLQNQKQMILHSKPQLYIESFILIKRRKYKVQTTLFFIRGSGLLVFLYIIIEKKDTVQSRKWDLVLCIV